MTYTSLDPSGVVVEFAGAELGNVLRSRRLEQIVAKVCIDPKVSFPKLFSTRAELEGFYRFIESDHFDDTDLLDPHVQRTCERAAAHQVVLALHDTTQFEFSGEAKRPGMGVLHGKGQGFLGHFSLLTTATWPVRPLGVTACRTWARTEPPRRRKNGRRLNGNEYSKHTAKESERWRDVVEETEARVPTSVVHVMDRESDSYELFSSMQSSGTRFVSRLRVDRVAGAELVVGDKDRVSALLSCAEVVAERTVPLSRRKEKSAPGARHHRARQEREARLSIRAVPMMLQCPQYLRKTHPRFLAVNVVQVVELEPPSGQQAVEWTLATSEPIETAEQVLRVIDYYRARWLIEEFFKALKTGCAIEKRQVESYDAMRKVLAMFVPIACKLLELRHMARTEPTAPATEVLTPVQLDVLRACGPRKLPAHPTVRDATFAVAGLGGHITNNGNPGWIVLGRGYHDLLTLEAGWVAAQASLRAGKVINR